MRLHETFPARGLVPTLTLATFVNHLNVIAWNPFLPFIAAELGVTVALLGQVPALMMLLATSLGLVIGPLADHYGYRRTLLLCLLAVVMSSMTTGLAATLPLLVLAAFVGAVGRAAIMPVAQAVVAAACADDTVRRRAVSRTQSGGPLAATVGIPVADGQRGGIAVARRLSRGVRAGARDRASPVADALPGRGSRQRTGPPDAHPGRLPAPRSASHEPDRDRRGVP